MPLVLVVEDEIFLRYVTADYLEDHGFSVLQAANADEAVGLLRRNRDVGAETNDEASRCLRDEIVAVGYTAFERSNLD